MKKLDSDKEIYDCFIEGKKYCYRIPSLRFNENGKTYSGVAPVWSSDNPKDTFTVPFYTHYDEIDLTTKKIEEKIRKYLEMHRR